MIFFDTPPTPTAQHLENQGPRNPLPDNRTGKFVLTLTESDPA